MLDEEKIQAAKRPRPKKKKGKTVSQPAEVTHRSETLAASTATPDKTANSCLVR